MKRYKDLKLESLHELFDLVHSENIKQLHKWGIQIVTPFEWHTYLSEEVGEVAKAISENYYRNGSLANVVKEAIQSATLSLKIAEIYLNEMDKLK